MDIIAMKIKTSIVLGGKDKMENFTEFVICKNEIATFNKARDKLGRSRGFRRRMRHRKINKRKQRIKDLRRFYDDRFELSSCHGRKIYSAVFGKKSGLLSKGYYGALKSPVKTKTKRAYASRGHKGGYGKAVCYSRHDKIQIFSMSQAMKDHWDMASISKRISNEEREVR